MNNVDQDSQGHLYVLSPRGYSAYEVAVQQGFVGTEDEWLESLTGPEGPDGKSAYQVAVDNGYIGTEEDWVNDFLTPDGYYNKVEVDVKLNVKPYYFDTVADMKAANNLKSGDAVITLGYYAVNDGGGALYKITDTASLIDYQEELENGLYATLIINNTGNILQYGCKDNVDCTSILQNIIKYFNNKTLIIPSMNVILSNSISLPDNITIKNFGKIKYTGDIDYLFVNEENNANKNIIFDGMDIEKLDNNFTNYNRFIRVTGGNLTVTNSKFTNYGTAIHLNEGEILKCKNIVLINGVGIAPQYGYGIDTSAKYDYIENIIAKNEDTTNGRHVLYLNGSQKIECNINNINVENWHHNPIEINLVDYSHQPIVNINNCYFKNCTIEATGSNPRAGVGSINVVQYGYGIITIKNIKQYDLINCLILSKAHYASIYIDNIDCNCTTFDSTEREVIYIRHGYHHRINNVFSKSMGTNGYSLIYLRDLDDPGYINNIITEEDTVGTALVTSDNSSVYNGFLLCGITYTKLVNSGTITALTTS